MADRPKPGVLGKLVAGEPATQDFPGVLFLATICHMSFYDFMNPLYHFLHSPSLLGAVIHCILKYERSDQGIP